MERRKARCATAASTMVEVMQELTPAAYVRFRQAFWFDWWTEERLRTLSYHCYLSYLRHCSSSLREVSGQVRITIIKMRISSSLCSRERPFWEGPIAFAGCCIVNKLTSGLDIRRSTVKTDHRRSESQHACSQLISPLKVFLSWRFCYCDETFDPCGWKLQARSELCSSAWVISSV